MAIILPRGLTTQEIRVLQEYRRLNAETMPAETIKAIRHPGGGGEGVAVGLASKGYLTADEPGENYVLTGKAKDFLAIEATPEVAPTSDAAASAAANPAADGT